MSRSQGRYRTFRDSWRGDYVRDILRIAREMGWTQEDLIEFFVDHTYTDDLDRLRNTMVAYSSVKQRNIDDSSDQ